MYTDTFQLLLRDCLYLSKGAQVGLLDKPVPCAWTAGPTDKVIS